MKLSKILLVTVIGGVVTALISYYVLDIHIYQSYGDIKGIAYNVLQMLYGAVILNYLR